MSHHFQAVKITDRVYWVGAIDWNIRDFHGYATDKGTTYNAFLVLGQKIALVETVKHGFLEEMLSRISSMIDPKKIDFIISNHSELDHSGMLPEMIEIVHPEAVYASIMGEKALTEHFRRNLNITPVKDGEILNLGGLTLHFLETRMLHWPDSMFAYLPEEKILFSQDGFGLHLASAERFDDELPQGFLEHESAKYYGNILLPYSTITLKILNKVKELNWDLKTIAPNHGIIWLKNPSHIIELYSRWASGKQLNKALIIFDTMWGSTAQMASAIAEGLKSGGTHPVMLHLRANHRSDIATQLLDAGALIVGTPNLNGNMFPTVADVLTYISGLKPQNLIGAVFGSYGWNTKALEQVETVLKEMKVELVAESIKSKYVPDAYTLDQCKALGMKISEKLKEKVI